MIALAENNLPEAKRLAEQLQLNPASPDMMNYLLPELASGHWQLPNSGLLLLKRSVTMCWRLLVEQDFVIYQPEFYHLRGWH